MCTGARAHRPAHGCQPGPPRGGQQCVAIPTAPGCQRGAPVPVHHDSVRGGRPAYPCSTLILQSHTPCRRSPVGSALTTPASCGSTHRRTCRTCDASAPVRHEQAVDRRELREFIGDRWFGRDLNGKLVDGEAEFSVAVQQLRQPQARQSAWPAAMNVARRKADMHGSDSLPRRLHHASRRIKTSVGNIAA